MHHCNIVTETEGEDEATRHATEIRTLLSHVHFIEPAAGPISNEWLIDATSRTEPAPQPSVMEKPNQEPVAEPAAEPVAEPAAEPVAEPPSKPLAETSTHVAPLQLVREDELIKQTLAYLRAHHTSQNSRMPLFVVTGPPGSGRSSLAEAVARVCEKELRPPFVSTRVAEIVEICDYHTGSAVPVRTIVRRRRAQRYVPGAAGSVMVFVTRVRLRETESCELLTDTFIDTTQLGVSRSDFRRRFRNNLHALLLHRSGLTLCANSALRDSAPASTVTGSSIRRGLCSAFRAEARARVSETPVAATERTDDASSSELAMPQADQQEETLIDDAAFGTGTDAVDVGTGADGSHLDDVRAAMQKMVKCAFKLRRHDIDAMDDTMSSFALLDVYLAKYGAASCPSLAGATALAASAVPGASLGMAASLFESAALERRCSTAFGPWAILDQVERIYWQRGDANGASGFGARKRAMAGVACRSILMLKG